MISFRKMSFQLAMQAALSGFNDSMPEFGVLVQKIDSRTFDFSIKSPPHICVGEVRKFPEKSFRIQFPCNPFGLRLWLFINYDHDKALRWFLSKTSINLADGASVAFEEQGIKIQTARALWNLALVANNGGFKCVCVSLSPEHRARQLYDRVPFVV